MTTVDRKIKTKSDNKDRLTFNGVCDLMSEPTPVESKKLQTKLTGLSNINEQIEEFFKSGGEVKEVSSDHRSIPEWCWHMDNYPKNYRR